MSANLYDFKALQLQELSEQESEAVIGGTLSRYPYSYICSNLGKFDITPIVCHPPFTPVKPISSVSNPVLNFLE